jgi:hypothetical protein
MRDEVMSMTEQWGWQHKQEGVHLGEAQLLTSILKARFHNLPREYLKKIETADVWVVNKETMNALSTSSVLKIFKD